MHLGKPALVHHRWILFSSLLLTFLTILSASVHAADENPQEFYLVKENGAGVVSNFQNPLALMSSAVEVTTGPRLSLMAWTLFSKVPPKASEKYNRKLHFGTWINDPNDHLCLNTRAKVLVRDSQRPVTYKGTNHCTVDTGYWNDPYTGHTFRASTDIQIDHVVPLKNAYTSGAFRWNFQSRCLYGNFVANNYHLLSVLGRENMAKGDKAPDDYMPPNPQVACGYLIRWLQIKLAWGLMIFPNEGAAIQNLARQYRCDSKQFSMAINELKRLRLAMREISPACDPKNGPL